MMSNLALLELELLDSSSLTNLFFGILRVNLIGINILIFVFRAITCFDMVFDKSEPSKNKYKK